MNKLLETPMENVNQKPSTRGGAGVYNSEPGLPQRTPSPNAVDEKLYDGEGGLPGKK